MRTFSLDRLRGNEKLGCIERVNEKLGCVARGDPRLEAWGRAAGGAGRSSSVWQ